MEKNIKINIPEGYNDAVFDKETNEIKIIKALKLGDKVTIDGVEGYVLEVDDAGKPTVLCSEILGDITWHDAMEKANQGLWHLPMEDEFRKYYKIIRELDGDWHLYWTSTEDNLINAHSVNTSCGTVGDFYLKTTNLYVRAFAFVGSKKDSKPRSWEEYCQNAMHTPCFRAISGQSSGKNVFEGNRYTLPEFNDFNTEKEAKAVVALCKLIQLRDAWWGKWRPNWQDGNYKFIIQTHYDTILPNICKNTNHVLAFPTEEMRDEFLETFSDLIEKAKPVL